MPGSTTETAGASEEMSEEGVSLSRRKLFTAFRNCAASTESFKSIGTALAATLAAGSASNSAQAAPRSVSADVDKNALLAKLVHRLTWGFTQAEYALAQQLGYEGYLEYHLNPGAINDSEMDIRLVAYPTLNMTSSEVSRLTAGQVVSELSESMLLRAVYSKRQLYERMVEFWTDHFSIDIDVDLCFYLKTVDDRVVVRANALGSFPNMLRASTQSPCMLRYLSNDTNLAGSPNENYARELMELHSISVAGGYTQADVREVARCFTGWSVSRQLGTSWGQIQFEAVYHDNGVKTVLGRNIPAGGGTNDVAIVVDLLAYRPATARFIAEKLCRKFLGEDVPTDVIDGVAASYVATGGDIKSMLRLIFRPENLYTDYGPRYKRPQHMMVSALRVLPVTIASTQILRITHLNGAGHMPFNWSPPDGYPDMLSHWQGHVLSRWNYAALLVTQGIPGLTFDVASYFAGCTTATQMIDRIDFTLFGGELPAPQKAVLQSFLAVNPSNDARQRDTVGLALSSPSFQWY